MIKLYRKKKYISFGIVIQIEKIVSFGITIILNEQTLCFFATDFIQLQLSNITNTFVLICIFNNLKMLQDEGQRPRNIQLP